MIPSLAEIAEDVEPVLVVRLVADTKRLVLVPRTPAGLFECRFRTAFLNRPLALLLFVLLPQPFCLPVLLSEVKKVLLTNDNLRYY
jgi:hypothetical protein